MANEERLTIPIMGTFFNTPNCTNLDELSADVAFLGAPQELGKVLRNLSGQRWAPQAIRDQRRYYYYTGREDDPKRPGSQLAVGRFNPDTGVEDLKGVTMADCGDVNILPTDGMANFDRITKVVKKILNRGAFPVVIGGDHATTFPVVRAFDKYQSLDIVQFDAHLDFSDEFEGVKIFEGSPIKRSSELPFVRNITQIGLELVRSKEPFLLAQEYGVKIITAEKFREIGVDEVVNSIPQAENIYITIDIDVLASSVAPGTGTPAIAGLTYLELKRALTGITKRGRVVGFDICEVDPFVDINNVTSRVSAELMLHLLAAIFPPKG